MSEKQSRTIALLAIIVFVTGSVYIALKKDPISLQANGTSAGIESLRPGAPRIATTTSSVYTLSDVAMHNSSASCWTTIRGKVYDVTPFISQHPGGKNPILGLCGKDGTEAFTNQHDTQSRPNNELAGFLIGTLSQ